MKLDDIEIPTTPACTGALDVAKQYCSPSLLNHSVRSYVWAAALGGLQDIPFDAELLYVAALLHDLGLVAEFDSHAVPFEDAGGQVAWVFATGAGWPVRRRARVAEVIVRHMWDRVDVAADAEGHLLERSTGLDISGRRTDEIPAGLRAEVLQRWPRLDIAAEFMSCITEQAQRKPDSTAGAAVRSGIAERIRGNPLDLDPVG
jgi:HD superfamily phosphodiesterase